MRRFRFLDHTGDLGIEIYGGTLAELFENAGEALFEVITDPAKVEEKLERRFTLRYDERETLLVDWLGELLYLHDTENLLCKRFEVEDMAGGNFRAKAWGESFHDGRHVIRTEVKAVTFHQLEVREVGGKWKARVILDL
jgi:SHS2 domain-containing protein